MDDDDDDDNLCAGMPCTVVEYVDEPYQGSSAMLRRISAERPATIERVEPTERGSSLLIALEGHCIDSGEARMLRVFERKKDAWVCTSHERVGHTMILLLGDRRSYNDEQLGVVVNTPE